MKQACFKALVSGRVQGVFFRDSTRREALRLGLQGYALNLDDGRVEVLACGAQAALNELAAWLAHGPPSAEVTALDLFPVEAGTVSGFTIA